MNSIEKGKIRHFGFIALAFFGCVFIVALWLKRPLACYFFGTLSTLGLGFILFPQPLGPVYKGWLKIAYFLNQIVVMTMLTVIYYGVITPSAFLKRIFGGRPIALRPDKSASSYWVLRSEPAQPRERFLKRY